MNGMVGQANAVERGQMMRCSNVVSGSTLLLFALGSPLMADESPKALFDFTGADAAKEWQTINDGVMGGVSEGKVKITDKKTLEFYGTLSLENNGGFASVRSKAKKLGLEKGDVLVGKVRGDGREYSMNLYVPRPLIAFSYRAAVQDEEGRVDRGQVAAGQVRGHVLRASGQGRRASRPC